jgi:hypothetical protein
LTNNGISINVSHVTLKVDNLPNSIKKINKLNIILGRLEKRKRDGEVYYIEKSRGM